MRALWAPLLMLCSLALPAHGEIYAAIGPNGDLQVSTFRKDASFISFDPYRSPVRKSRIPPSARPVGSEALDGFIELVAGETGTDPKLLHAIIHVESAYDARAVSRAGAIGLMQVMPMTGKRFGVADLYDPVQNLRAGASYLKVLMKRFSGDLHLALAAYNAGEGAVERYGNHPPPYAETRNYVQQVLARYRGEGRFTSNFRQEM